MDAGLEGDATTAVASEFTETLGTLKERGSTILLVGPPDYRATAVGCRRLLGDELLTERERLFVLTDTAPDDHPGVSLGKHGDPADSGIVRYHTEARSVAAAAPTAGPAEPAGPSGPDAEGFAARVPTSDVSADLDRLADEVSAEMDRLDARTGGLDAGELRVCIDDLGDMLSQEGGEAVNDFLHEVRANVLERDAMCHAHLSTDVPDAPLDAVGDAFDAIVEVDYDGDAGHPKQRWHVPEAGLSTGWLAL